MERLSVVTVNVDGNCVFPPHLLHLRPLRTMYGSVEDCTGKLQSVQGKKAYSCNV
jgi:hypothetical protein